MNTLVHADIFFFITTIAVTILTLLLIVVLFYIARTVRTVAYLVEKIKNESEQVIDDLSDLREKLKESGSQVSGFGKWFLSFLFGKAVAGAFNGHGTKRGASKKTKKEEVEE